jgi:alanyl-tRNA synthetase
MNFDQIRQKFLTYFEQHGHRVVASSSLAPLPVFRNE